MKKKIKKSLKKVSKNSKRAKALRDELMMFRAQMLLDKVTAEVMALRLNKKY